MSTPKHIEIMDESGASAGFGIALDDAALGTGDQPVAADFPSYPSPSSELQGEEKPNDELRALYARGKALAASGIPGPAPADQQPLTFTYRNYRGEVSERTVVAASSPYWGSTEWHPEPQWLIQAFDQDKQAWRDFALKDMVFSPSPAPSGVEGELLGALKGLAREMAFMLRANPAKDGGLYRARLDEANAAIARAEAPSQAQEGRGEGGAVRVVGASWAGQTDEETDAGMLAANLRDAADWLDENCPHRYGPRLRAAACLLEVQ